LVSYFKYGLVRCCSYPLVWWNVRLTIFIIYCPDVFFRYFDCWHGVMVLWHFCNDDFYLLRSWRQGKLADQTKRFSPACNKQCKKILVLSDGSRMTWDTIAHRCKVGRSPASVGCVTIAKPDSLSSSETRTC
jgi:hypothetical protein